MQMMIVDSVLLVPNMAFFGMLCTSLQETHLHL
jgi:hypothetical protein